jgi:hypothetical protein
MAASQAAIVRGQTRVSRSRSLVDAAEGRLLGHGPAHGRVARWSIDAYHRVM